MRKITTLLFIMTINLGVVNADEGMWLPSLVKSLNITDMHNGGFKLTAEQLYSVNNRSIKDAIVAINFGSCTGEIISDQGLMLTNHHCGFADIQRHSSVENDYLKDGFWAATKADELPNSDKNVSFLIEMRDVTEALDKGVDSDMSEEEIAKQKKQNRDDIIAEAKEGNHYRAEIESLFNDNAYYLFIYETFTDIRLVGAPPSSIGKFGGDTDNWMWPRHTGDFSLFRVYTSADGTPADYSVDNVPLKPRHHLPISLAGVEEGDFSMILGFPGSTDRYLSSWGVENTMNITNKTREDVRGVKLDIIKAYMKSSAEARIKYASKAARSSNYWKYSIGQNRGLKRLNVIDSKRDTEQRFAKWIELDEAREQEYGDVLEMLERGHCDYRDSERALNYLIEAILRGPEIVLSAGQSKRFLSVLDSGDSDKIEKISAKYLESIESGELAQYFKDYDAATDQKLCAALFELYKERVPSEYWPEFISEIEKDGGDYEKYAATMFKKSIFTSPERLKKFIEKPSYSKLSKDPALVAYIGTSAVLDLMKDDRSERSEILSSAEKLFLKGVMEMDGDSKNFYPDANSTMRLTFGKVGGYEPRDGVVYDYFTTIDGYKEKGIAGDVEFDVPQHLLDLYSASDYGRYADSDGKLRTCFITNNDITGGNSGSPVINSKGELIGCAFDGNWEAMSGDIAFETDLQRCINVDIRFVLWVIDEYAGASHIVDEMTIQ